MRIQLVPLDGGEPVVVVREINVVGRKEDCDLFLDHKSVSKVHCILVKGDGLLLLRDVGSTNGTRVNGQRVRRATVLPNDQLHIASLRYRVEVGADVAPMPAVSVEEHTQQIDAKELAKAIGKAKKELDDADDADGDSIPPQVVRTNPLPDVYPDDGTGKGKK